MDKVYYLLSICNQPWQTGLTPLPKLWKCHFTIASKMHFYFCLNTITYVTRLNVLRFSKDINKGRGCVTLKGLNIRAQTVRTTTMKSVVLLLCCSSEHNTHVSRVIKISGVTLPGLLGRLELPFWSWLCSPWRPQRFTSGMKSFL